MERGHAARRLAADMNVERYGNHFSNNTFIPLVVETSYGCPDSAFDGYSSICSRRAAEPLGQVRAIHHRVARAVQNSNSSLQSTFVMNCSK
jgi:hypothetical protein